MAGITSVGGLISGIDTNSILDQLYELARSPIRRLEARRAELSNESTAWSLFEARLLAFRTVANRLAVPVAFQARAATTSRSDLVAASASASAVEGTYIFKVTQLAQTHQEISGGYADVAETEFGAGTVSISVGGADPTVIQTEGLTLAELRDAINATDAGVSAAIINDGTDATPYRLVITSRTSGLDGEMALTSGGAAPAFTELQAAQDAQITLGSGTITVSSSSNTMAGAIPGVTLNLLAAEPATSVSLTVSRDTASIRETIADFVGAYNEIVGFLADQFYYNTATGETGTLFSDYRLQSLQYDLGAVVTNSILGITSSLNSLSALGIRSDSTGRLIQDSAALAAALADDPDAVARVFAAIGQTSDPAASYLSATENTRASGSAGWAVTITQAARQAQVTAGVAQTDTLLADEVVTIQGVQISLSAGMTAGSVVDTINAYQQQTGVVASRGAGKLALTRTGYGSAFHIEAVSSLSNQSNTRTSGIGNVAVTEADPTGESGAGAGQTGLDVQGTIGGEAATGTGQHLKGTTGGPEGLSLLITAASPGSCGTVVFTIGAAEASRRLAVSATDSIDGAIAASQQRIDDLIGNINEEIARLESMAQREQERLRASFTRMETALSRFQAQNQFLTSQLSQIQGNSSRSGS